MTGPVYENALKRHGLERLIPGEVTREQLNTAIFDELCLGVFNASTTNNFLGAIEDPKSRGAECVILGCTEIPLIVTPENSPLPTLDSTRLLAKYAILEALSERPITANSGWLPVSE
jgi:aspartate racemase